MRVMGVLLKAGLVFGIECLHVPVRYSILHIHNYNLSFT